MLVVDVFRGISRMDNEMLDNYLRDIEDFVLDEDKIVTYKWLSRKLAVHVNIAKHLLNVYVAKQKKKTATNFTATYLITGKQKDGSHCVSIVIDKELDNVKSMYEEITSEHVYSIQRSAAIKNIQLLHAVEKFDKENEGVIITCSKSKLKQVTIAPKTVDKEKPAKSNNEPSVSSSTKTDPKKEDKESAKREFGSKKESPKKGNKNTISSMFSAQANKPKATEEKKNPPAKNQKNGKIGNFFNNSGNVKPKVNDDVKDEQSEKVNEKVENKKASPEESEENNKEEDSKKNVTQNKSKPAKTKETKRKSKKKTQVDETEAKKRKRIRVFTDSEDSDNEPEREPSPAPDDEPEDKTDMKMDTSILDEEECPKNKRKKRKIVDKMVLNEDGYMETKKEVVYETDSDQEVENVKPVATKDTSLQEKDNSLAKKPKLESTSNKTKGSGPCPAKKQASLLSFFKKN